MNKKILLIAVIAVVIGRLFFLTNTQDKSIDEKPIAKKEHVKPALRKSPQHKKVVHLYGYLVTEDFRWLIQQSKAIIIGSVEHSTGVVTMSDGFILTKWKIKVVKNIKSDVSENITILSAGGETTETKLLVKSSIILEPGQDYLFFLSKRTTSDIKLKPDTYGLKSMTNIYKIVNKEAISKKYKLPLKDLLARIDEGLRLLPPGSDAAPSEVPIPLGVRNFEPEPSPMAPIKVD